MYGDTIIKERVMTQDEILEEAKDNYGYTGKLLE